MNRSHNFAAFGSAIAALAITSASAGPLDPPAGPVAPTHKTLTEVEPRTVINDVNTPGDSNSIYRITEPGSYYLTANVSGATSMHGIEIASSNVTIDLNGFTLLNEASGSFDGITGSSGNERITIRNGFIEGWSQRGIDLVFNQIRDVRIEDIVVRGNTSDGIRTSSFVIIARCQADSNGSSGFSVEDQGTLRDCISSGNDGDGIRALDSVNITGCSIIGNAGDGISAGSAGIIENCTVLECEGIGIDASFATIVRDCVVRSNDSDGIEVGSGSLVDRCVAQFNSVAGIDLGAHSTVTNCTSYANTGSGIVLFENSQALNNVCSTNGNGGVGAGIHATGNYNRIESNYCAENDSGFDIDGVGNLVVKNSAKINTVQFDIGPSNDAGTIVTSPVGAGSWDNIQF